MQVDFPLSFDGNGRTAAAVDDRHILQMIELVLFTEPGERINRPDFGAGLGRMLFAPLSPEIAAAFQYTAKAALQRWLGDLVEIKELVVSAEDATVLVSLRYLVRRSDEVRTADLQRGLPG